MDFNYFPNIYTINNVHIITIQRYTRGFLYRIKKLPLMLYVIQDFLSKQNYNFININNDGRINSNFDEEEIINILIQKYGSKIKKPAIRNWFDVAIYDNYYGWLPVNIKSTTTITSDNVGNLALCVYAYTNCELDLNSHYDNGQMATILFDKLKKREYNKKYKKDYYFLVLNKNDNKSIIINSVKGLTHLTPNINNLPFQVKWLKNSEFCYKNIIYSIEQFINTIKNPRPSWKETFLANIRNNF
jgi:hypothetical protein|tara:strand:+ start:1364 stop:2095 length:732 start_codon:yes stop_codon:yes gene_type:complete